MNILAGDAGGTKTRLALYEQTNVGGLYLGGGIPPKLISKFREGGTVEAYLRKGRLSPLVELTPLRVIMNERAALQGAASIAAALR